MRKFFNIIFALVFFLFFGFNSIAAEKTAELLSPEWSFKGFLENLIEHPYKEDTKFISRFAQHVIQ